MKILQLVQKPQLRGAEVFACQLSDQLNSLGHEALIVSVFEGEVTLPSKARQFHLRRSAKKRSWDFEGYKKLARIIKDEKPDVIQANAGDTLKYAVMSKLIFRWNKPIVFRNASTISLYIRNKMTKAFYSFFFKRAKKIISVSETSAKDFGVLYPDYKHKIITIPIGIEEFSFAKNNSARKDGPILVHVGGFSYEKNHAGLLSIFKKFLKVKPNAVLHLVGSGPLHNEIVKNVSSKGLKDNITFHGHQKNAIDFIKGADVLLLPSIIEGLPGVILEAFYCRTPVVAYNVGGIGEIVINNETGRLIEKGNEEMFVAAISEALEKNDTNERFINNAYHLVTSNYMNLHIARRFASLYHTLLS